MCTVIASMVSTGASVGSSALGFMGAKKSAAEQNLYNMKVEAQQQKYRAEVMGYQNKAYEQDVKYGGEVLAYQKDEFRRQGEHLGRASNNIQENYFGQMGTLMKRMVEENIAAAFQMEDVGKTARRERSTRQVQADARGVEGASVEAVIDAVSRQEGDAISVMELNRSATHRQLMLEAMQLKTNADGAIMNLPVQTYQPTAPVQPPSPVAQVTPAQKVAGPSVGSLIAGVTGSLVTGAQNYEAWSRGRLSEKFGIK